MAEKFSLKWNEFHSNVSTSFKSLRDEEYLQDVTLVGDDSKHIRAHKLVLSACSDFFREIFKKGRSHEHLMICLDGISSKLISNVLDYAYHGEVQIFQDEIDNFLDVALRLKLQGMLPSEEMQGKNLMKAYEGQMIETKDDFYEGNVANLMKCKNQDLRDDPKVSQQIVKSDLVIPFKSMEELDEQIKDYIEKDNDGNWRCALCAKTTKKISHIKNHIETHIEGLSFSCPQCPAVLRSRNNLASHTTRQHNI